MIATSPKQKKSWPNKLILCSYEKGGFVSHAVQFHFLKPKVQSINYENKSLCVICRVLISRMSYDIHSCDPFVYISLFLLPIYTCCCRKDLKLRWYQVSLESCEISHSQSSRHPLCLFLTSVVNLEMILQPKRIYSNNHTVGAIAYNFSLFTNMLIKFETSSKTTLAD